MESEKWFKSDRYPGVRWREIKGRTYGKRSRPDRYFIIRYTVGNKTFSQGLGWASQKMTEKKAYDELCTARSRAQHAQEHRLKHIRRQEDEKQRRSERASCTVADFWKNHYVPAQPAEKKTSKREEQLFRLWISPVIGRLPVAGVTGDNIKAIGARMRKAESSNRTVEYALAVARQVFVLAVERGFRADNPARMRKKDRPKIDNRRMRRLSPEEVGLLLAEIRKHSLDLYDLTVMALGTGMRFGELAALTWHDVDTDQGVIYIRDAKAGTRTAGMNDVVRRLLEDRKKMKTGGLVFPGRTGEKMKQVSATFIRICDQLFNQGVTDSRLRVVFHSLRHTVASAVLEDSGDITLVQAVLGHKTLEMARRYAKDSATARQRAYATTQRLLSSGMENPGHEKIITEVN